MTIMRSAYRRIRGNIYILKTTYRLQQLKRMGLYQYLHVIPAQPTATPYNQIKSLHKLRYDTFRVPNISGFYHGLLRDLWEKYGLGRESLLISESIDTRQAFSEKYPDTTFIATDYYIDLQSCSKTDVLWDICSPEIPESLQHGLDSIICQATMEHIWTPEAAMRNLFSVLNVSGKLYLHTHTPIYEYHAWPKDYLRYWPDWFIDVEQHIPGVRLLELLCVAGHAFAAYEKKE